MRRLVIAAKCVPSKRLLISAPRQQGAAGSDIGKRSHRRRVGQKHFGKNHAIAWLHPAPSIDLLSTKEDNLIIVRFYRYEQYLLSVVRGATGCLK